jgi:Putative silver efflux pump
MRSGKNASQTIQAVKTRLAELQRSLPAGVEIVPVYDRSGLIERAVKNLGEKLLQEFLVVALVCLAFLFHLRSALVASISLPLGVLMAFIVMQQQGINANVMSLGGIAIAIGAMVDAAIVMIENAHKHLERWANRHPGETLQGEPRWRVIGEAAAEVGPALFFVAHHHTKFHPGFHARGAGGPPLCTAGLYQDLRHGRVRWLGRHADPSANGLSDSRAYSC